MVHLKRFYIYCIAFFACILLSAHAFAQPQARGFGNAAPAAASTSAGRTVALVVGVSDYPFVAPLNYAAEDALLMYDFLQSKAGGSLPKENIRLLINEEATSQNVWTRGLLWIKSSFIPNRSDRVIIYLAGHGDADEYNSYFLCHNANPAGDKGNYNWTDVLNIEALKKYIAGFSATGAEVLLIMDACRSGDIPGARTGITNPFESVVERRAGETLMLSASANQLAVEDRRWGRGHGAFTWNLVQGLSGKADENEDGDIDFYEIEQYTKAKVRKETQAMGRMQVPQFAAAPSGGGVLGRVDNAFLNKLSTEALSSVSVSESIAQARTAAESSWFTDSTLYSGFNELKKLVRDGKYLGEGSAEPVYTRLAAEFTEEQIEPVRLYYMSALASAGFEAINKELTLNIGVTVTIKFYERRLAYLNKAYLLQRKPNEVYLLENYRKLVEAIYLQGRARDERNWEFQFTQQLVDSLSSMRIQFQGTAAYYLWMGYLCIDPWTSKRPNLRPGKPEYLEEWSKWEPVYARLQDSIYHLAPDWPKLLEARLNEMKVEECTQQFGDKLLKLLETDSLNAEYWYLLSLYYRKHKPYDIPNSFKCLLRSCSLRPNMNAAATVFSLATMHGTDLQNTKDWLAAEALRNHYNYEFTEDEWQLMKSITIQLLKVEYSDEMEADNQANLGFHDLIHYAIENVRYDELMDIFSNYERLEELSYDLDELSAVASTNSKYAAFGARIDSALIVLMRTKDWIGQKISDERAQIIASRINAMLGFPSLHEHAWEQMNQLSRLVLEKNSRQLTDEYIVFQSRVYTHYKISKDLQVSDGYLDSLLELCHRDPDKQKYWAYWRIISSRKMQERVLNLYSDESFRQLTFKDHKGVIDSTFHFQVEADVYCIGKDTASLISLMEKCSNSWQNAYFRINYYLDSESKEVVARNVKFSADTSINGYILLIDNGRYNDALKMFDQLNTDSAKISDYLLWKFFVSNINMFNNLHDFKRSSEWMEKYIDAVSGFDGLSGSSSLAERMGPYDAFIQSKEYKAMMARVYTAPEK